MSFSPDLTAGLTSYDMQGTALIEINAKALSATDKEYFSVFTNQMDVSKPVNPKLMYLPATGYGLVDKGATPSQIQRSLDYKKSFYPRGFGAMVTLADEDIQDATAYGGGAKELLNMTKNALPECRRIVLNQMAAAMLVCGVQGNLVPATMPWLDVLCADGKSYFNEAHTYKVGGVTYSNIAPTADLTPSIAALESMFNTGNAIRLGNGLPTYLNYDTMIFGKGQGPTWTQLFNSQYDPETALNAINKARGLVGRAGNTNLYESPWLPNDFFVAMASNMEKHLRPVQHVIYKQPKIDSMFWKLNRTWYYIMYSRENMMASVNGFGATCSWAKITS